MPHAVRADRSSRCGTIHPQPQLIHPQPRLTRPQARLTCAVQCWAPLHPTAENAVPWMCHERHRAPRCGAPAPRKELAPATLHRRKPVMSAPQSHRARRAATQQRPHDEIAGLGDAGRHCHPQVLSIRRPCASFHRCLPSRAPSEALRCRCFRRLSRPLPRHPYHQKRWTMVPLGPRRPRRRQQQLRGEEEEALQAGCGKRGRCRCNRAATVARSSRGRCESTAASAPRARSSRSR